MSWNKPCLTMTFVPTTNPGGNPILRRRLLAQIPWICLPVLTAAASILAPFLLGHHIDRNFDLIDWQIGLLSLQAALLPVALSIGLYWFLLSTGKVPQDSSDPNGADCPGCRNQPSFPEKSEKT